METQTFNCIFTGRLWLKLLADRSTCIKLRCVFVEWNVFSMTGTSSRWCT
ncbi:Uncharacterized protein APZ42_004505 [Daphnia magna]|uniref:Uncharacterized protein n=1 Tax=Daphnia magna TaxID=35525 RepID=A0A0P5N5Z4_9CRUS|nr:Uncharacterized protein APZ42_004505 [Daphnia magna]